MSEIATPSTVSPDLTPLPDDLPAIEQVEWYRARLHRMNQELHQHRSKPSQTMIVASEDEEDEGIPLPRILREVSSAHKRARGYKWLAGLVAVVFIAGGSFAAWNGALVTAPALEEFRDANIKPVQKRLTKVEENQDESMSALSNILSTQERERQIDEAKEELAEYQHEREEELADWQARQAKSRHRLRKPSKRKELVDAEKKVRALRSAPLILKPVDLESAEGK